LTRRHRDIERRLRAERPAPRPAFLARTVASISRRPAPAFRPRVAVAGALSALMLVAFASVGGIGYAANAVSGAAATVKKAVAPKKQRQAIAVLGLTAGGDQYQPGFGFGDPNHNHAGPPGLQRGAGEPGGPAPAAPPLRARPLAGQPARLVPFTITLDEQASLRIHVLDPSGRPLLITQSKSRIGSGRLTGRQTKTIRYLVRVPRTIPMQLRIPANLLRPGQTYRVRVIAIDHEGNRSQLIVPFTV
jgi:hypothetical protein